jgi:hypothetical protein
MGQAFPPPSGESNYPFTLKMEAENFSEISLMSFRLFGVDPEDENFYIRCEHVKSHTYSNLFWLFYLFIVYMRGLITLWLYKENSKLRD